MKTSDPWIIFCRSFQFICIIIVLVLVIWCFVDYFKDEDVVEIIFRRYGEDETCIYPDITLCSESPYNTEKLKLFDNNITKYLYTTHLLGRDFIGNWDKKILDIDYHNASLHLNDYLISKPIYYTSKSLKMNQTIDRTE